ncbi:MAG: two-component system response regulator RppA [Leptolyngbyaceae bacterium]|nr:two-component system response regulator RppA [Leptolyngbyaceae bacterium]
MRILLVDDEVELTDPLGRVLTREGYTVDIVHDGAEGSRLAGKGDYDLLILDWMLPHLTGLEICQRLRSQGDTTPVLFLTARDTIDNRVQGLDSGADDYLVKPFELRELMARVRALLRRPPTLEAIPSNTRLCAEGLELDRENQIVYRQGQAIELSEKEGQLLEYFMQNPGQLLSHAQIEQHLWGDEAPKPSSNALAAQVRLLRRKIEADHKITLIHTVYGRGYRFGGATLP